MTSLNHVHIMLFLDLGDLVMVQSNPVITDTVGTRKSVFINNLGALIKGLLLRRMLRV